MFQITDSHVHTETDSPDPEVLLQKLEQSRVGELVVLSIAPSCFPLWKKRAYSNAERLDGLLQWCRGTSGCIRFTGLTLRRRMRRSRLNGRLKRVFRASR